MASLLAAVALVASGWQQAAPMPRPRSEVAATPYGGGIALVGGFSGSCVNTRDVDLYLPATNTWRALPRLPIALNHAVAAGVGKRLYVAGGYGENPRFSRATFVYDGRRWKRLATMPGPRAAAGSAIVGGKWYVAGGVTPGAFAGTMLVLDLKTGRWSTAPGPTPREHLAVTAAKGKIYALAGRQGGYDTNLSTFEVYTPATGRWEKLPPVPESRGGTGLAAVGSLLVSVGGEEPAGTIRSVYGFDTSSGSWRRLPDLPTPRHGLGVVAVGTTVYAIGGGDVPGCSTSPANEVLQPR